MTCPDCKVEVAEVTSGSVLAHRCARCRGVWLDPRSFQRLCEEEARPPEDDGAIVPSRGATAPSRTPAQTERIRYRACPQCGEVMNRSNFGRVSGVVIDVCRPHGAWFDRGELGAIRRFLREGGVARYERRRELDRAWPSASTSADPAPGGASLDDIYDLLVGSDASWDVPSRIPRLLVAAVFGALGAWLLWRAFQPGWYSIRGVGASAVAGIIALYFAWRALGQWLARRRR